MMAGSQTHIHVYFGKKIYFDPVFECVDIMCRFKSEDIVFHVFDPKLSIFMFFQ